MKHQPFSHNLLQLVEQKHKLLLRIYDLTVQQTKAISDKQIKEFLSLSSEKQVLIDQVNLLDDLFQQQYDTVKKSTDSSDFTHVLSKHFNLKEMQSMIEEVQKVTDNIKQVELKNKEEHRKVLLEMSAPLSMINKQEKIQKYKKMNDYKKHKK